jgi:hypothetical protein
LKANFMGLDIATNRQDIATNRQGIATNRQDVATNRPVRDFYITIDEDFMDMCVNAQICMCVCVCVCVCVYVCMYVMSIRQVPLYCV